MPNRMSEDMSDRMPNRMPEDMPDRMPNRMSEDMSDRMPEDVPVRKCINVMVGITRSKVIFYSFYTCSCDLWWSGSVYSVKVPQKEHTSIYLSIMYSGHLRVVYIILYYSSLV